MHSFWQVQSFLPHFSGHIRQKSSRLGALAAGDNRKALPSAEKLSFLRLIFRIYGFYYEEEALQRSFEVRCENNC